MILLNGWSINESGHLVRPDSRVCGPNDEITAAEIEEAIGIPRATTTFFNHSGSVPAAHVVREARDNGIRQRAPGGGRKPADPTGEKRTVHVGVRVTPCEAERIRELGGLAKLIRDKLEQTGETE